MGPRIGIEGSRRQLSGIMSSRTQIDRLGDRLRHSVISDEDLRLLDAYRRDFEAAYRSVVDRLRERLDVDVTGRPSKSTAAILDKLRREHIRLSQIQDIAGCRIVTSNIVQQEELRSRIDGLFPAARMVDRREASSHGYRAVHILVDVSEHVVEIQLRTQLQHLWAEISEKLSDLFGNELKYGKGNAEVRRILENLSTRVKNFEDIEMQQHQLAMQTAQLATRVQSDSELAGFEADLEELASSAAEVGRMKDDLSSKVFELLRSIHDMLSKRSS